LTRKKREVSEYFLTIAASSLQIRYAKNPWDPEFLYTIFINTCQSRRKQILRNLFAALDRLFELLDGYIWNNWRETTTETFSLQKLACGANGL
jgi:hypothetical protein